jgi:hypothetical protein
VEDACPDIQPAFIRMKLNTSVCEASFTNGVPGRADSTCPNSTIWSCSYRCTLQLHPESKQVLPGAVLVALKSSRLKATECRLIGPAPGSSSIDEYGVEAEEHAIVTLVSSRHCISVA